MERTETTMRQQILASAAALLICGAVPNSSTAQVITFDPTNYVQALQQVVQLTQQLRVMQQQYQQLMQTYQAISHLPDNVLRQVGQQLNIDQFRNALPSQSSILASAMNGTGLGTGNLGLAARNYLKQNLIYAPGGKDFQSMEMQRNANSVAGSQAMASELYQSAANRVAALQGIEGLLASAPDAKAVADIQARIAAEQAYIQAQQVQAQSLAMWQASQERNQQHRTLEERRRQVDDLIEQAKAHGG
jgi:type IV secretion system protein VirB5